MAENKLADMLRCITFACFYLNFAAFGYSLENKVSGFDTKVSETINPFLKNSCGTRLLDTSAFWVSFIVDCGVQLFTVPGSRLCSNENHAETFLR